jgi:hypothetical protein
MSQLRAESIRSLYGGIFAIAFATLLFELSLIRILSFTIWYHFAYVAISTALLGFGASGTLLAVWPSIGAADPRRALARASLATALCGAAAGVFVANVPLHPMRLAEDRGQLALLVAYLIVVTVPFFFSGITIALALREAAEKVDRLYFWDLLGAGLACGVVVPLMNRLTPPGALTLACAAAAVAAFRFAGSRGLRIAAAAVGLLLLFAAPFADRLPYVAAESKHSAFFQRDYGARPVYSHWSGLFRTDLFAFPEGGGPRRDWGYSRVAPDPEQRPWGHITHDGTAGTHIYDRGAGDLAFLDDHVLSTPYRVANPEPNVLVIGVGGGIDIHSAARHGARHITGVELDPVTVELIRDQRDDLARGLLQRDDITLVSGEGRHFVNRSQDRYDVIQITGADTLAATSSGAYVLAENYLYTVEAFDGYLDHLAPGGVLSIANGHVNSEEPRAAGRMVSVARHALENRGIDAPGRHIAVIHSRNLIASVLVKNEPFSKAQLATLAAEARRLGFDPLLLGEVGHPVFLGLANARGNALQELFDSLAFEVDPVSDDRPFFFRFWRWGDLLDQPELGPVHTTALGQLVLAFLLISLSALGALFVLLPLAVFRRRGLTEIGGATLGILGYFLALGLGFMLFEISLLQRFVVYLGYPTYSLSVVMFSLLTFLGFGSLLSRRWVGRETRVLPAAVGAIGVLAFFYMRGLPILQEATLGSPLALRVLLTVAVLAPLGLTLGAFFPLGIRRAEALHEDLVPWAWAINGCASVTGTVLAVVLAMNMGFERVWLTSLAIYALGAAALLLTPAPADAATGSRVISRHDSS